MGKPFDVTTWGGYVVGWLHERWARLDPTTRDQVVLCGMGVAVVAVALHPELAFADFPLPGMDQMVTDAGAFAQNQGGLLSVIGGVGAGALKLAFSHGESGIGHFARAGAGGAVFGATPDLATYFVQ